jgi:tetratricopeptide (TPR) repeat protein
MAFGIWFTIVIVMLSKQIRARRRFAAAVRQVASHPAVRLSPTPVMAPVPESAKPVPVDLRAQNAPARLPNNATAKKPTRKIEIDFNADEILSKADVFMQGKNSSEAVKLLELAIKLQPDQLSFVVRLLEIYHKLKHDIAFGSLLERFRPTLAELECSEQVRLQVMYGRLCPQATPLIDPEQTAAENAAEEALAFDSPDEEAAAQDQHEPELDLALGDDDGEEYIATEVLVMNNGVLLDDDSRASSGMVGEVIDLEDTLNEIDVYLAYGLYDNAEELALKGLEVEPNRVDFLIKLLDAYYATKNLVDFVTCAETLRDMGDEVINEYWDKVEVMGYELAPYNELFAAGKNRNPVSIGLEFAKPESADLDIGSGDDDTDAVDEESNLELDKGEAEGLSQDEFADDGNQHSLTQLDSADELVAKILADHQDDDPTNINFDDWRTSNITIDKDEPILKDQVDDGDEDVDEDEPLKLDPIEDDIGETDEDELLESVPIVDETVESDEYTELDLDQVAVNLTYSSTNTDTDPEDTMRFTIADESKLEATGDDIVNGPMDDAQNDNTALDMGADTGSGDILLFPNQSNGRKNNNEFESEVKTTLQSIRDQLQNITERLYQQERGTTDLRQTLTELRDQDDASRRKGNKKSS